MFTRKRSMRSSTHVLVAVAALLAAADQGRAQFKFGEPENLGAVLNTPYWDGGPSIATDNLTLFYWSRRPEGFGAGDLWATTRDSVSDPWQAPKNLGPTVNGSTSETSPSISADGLTIYFSSGESRGGEGGRDLWMTTRTGPSDPWQSPVNLGPVVNSPYYDSVPDITADGLTLFFGSRRPGGSGGGDLWMTTRTRRRAPWQPPVNLGPTVNSSVNDNDANISADGLTLFFSSFRPGGSGAQDLWLTTRTRRRAPWQPPVNLGSGVNTSAQDGSPSISADGRMLYFRSTRPGGWGAQDLWQVSVMRECSGKEKVKKPKCRKKRGEVTMTVKLKGGLDGDLFTVTLCSGEVEHGTINKKGKGKAKFSELPSGPGTATATWGCGAKKK